MKNYPEYGFGVIEPLESEIFPNDHSLIKVIWKENKIGNNRTENRNKKSPERLILLSEVETFPWRDIWWLTVGVVVECHK